MAKWRQQLGTTRTFLYIGVHMTSIHMGVLARFWLRLAFLSLAGASIAPAFASDLTAQMFLIPSDPRHQRDPQWPDRLTLVDAPAMFTDDFMKLLKSSDWVSVQACDGQPMTAAWLSRNLFLDHWNTGRLQIAFGEKIVTRFITYPAPPKRPAVEELSSSYQVTGQGWNTFRIDFSLFAFEIVRVKKIVETGELVLDEASTYPFCPDGTRVNALLVPLEPNIY